MKSKTNHKSIIALTILLILLSAFCFAKEYEIVKVIKAGEIDGAPISGPLKWSPDGKHMAFFEGGYLTICDTLGNRKQIAQLDMSPRRLEWLSDEEIIVFLKRYSGENKRTKNVKLVNFNIDNGQKNVLKEYTGERFKRRGGLTDGYFEGPYLTTQKNLYYYRYQDNEKILVLPQSNRNPKVDYQNNYIYRFDKGGLYLVRADLLDSIYVFDKSQKNAIKDLGINYLFRNQFITNVTDSQIIQIDTFSVHNSFKQNKIQCGVMWQAVNPGVPEVIFTMNCDFDEYDSVHRSYIYNITNNYFTNIDEIIGQSDSYCPQYSNDGKNISVLSQSEIFIILRREM